MAPRAAEPKPSPTCLRPEAVVVSFADGGTTDESRSSMTDTSELPVDIQQLLDESEREAVELFRASAANVRHKLLSRHARRGADGEEWAVEAHPSTTPAALKTVLDEQTQWLKAILDRASSHEALSSTAAPSLSAPFPLRCCRRRWGIGDRHPLTRRFKLAPLEAAYRESVHLPRRMRVRVVGLCCLVYLVSGAATATADWRNALDRWRSPPEDAQGAHDSSEAPDESELLLTIWAPVALTGLMYSLLFLERRPATPATEATAHPACRFGHSQPLICCFLLCFTLSLSMVVFVYSDAPPYDRSTAPSSSPPEGLIAADAALDSLWYALTLDLLLVIVATVSGLEPHVAAVLALALATILHARQHLNWRRQYGQEPPWGPEANLLPVTIAIAVAYSQANLSRTAFAAHWLRVQDRDTQLEQMARAKSHADHERMKVELKLSSAAAMSGGGVHPPSARSVASAATPVGMVRRIEPTGSAVPSSASSSAWPTVGPTEAFPGRPGCFPRS